MNPVSHHHANPSWLALASAALGLSAVAACALVMAHLPGTGAPGRTIPFARALVIHVDLALLVWLQANACALWTTARPKGPDGFGLALAGTLGLVICALLGTGSPVLADYFPYLDGGAFLAWAGLFLTATLFCSAGPIRRPASVTEAGLLLSRLPWLWVLADLTLRATIGGPAERTLREVVWAAGHLALISAMAVLMSLWWRWRQAPDPRPGTLRARVAIGLLGATVLPGFLPPLLMLAGWRGEDLHTAYTVFMSALSWPSAMALGLWAVLGRRIQREQSGPIPWGLSLSLGLFVLGCVLGLLITRQTTLIPAHYHGTLGALTLAFMAMQLDQFRSPHASRPLAFYASGLALMLIGLAGSGLAGAPRKEGFTSLASLDPLFPLLTGVGGGLAVVATLWFTSLVLPEALRTCLIQFRHPAARNETFASEQRS